MNALLKRLSRYLPRPETAQGAEPALDPLSSNTPEARTGFEYLSGPQSRLDHRVLMGTHTGTAREFYLDPHHRQAHTYVAGVTGSGKTRWMQQLIFQDLSKGHPVCVLDPFGGLFRSVREYVATGIEHAAQCGFLVDELLQRTLFLDLTDVHNPLRLNPLEAQPDETSEQQVDDLMKVLERVLGNTLAEQRKLRNVLRGAFLLTAELNRLAPEQRPVFPGGSLMRFPLGLHFAADILNMTDQQRFYLMNALPADTRLRFRQQYWQFYAHLGQHEKNQVVQSSWNVFQFLLDDSLALRFFDTRQSTLHIPDLLHAGTSLICFLPLRENLAGAQLVGKFLTTKLQNAAFRRPLEDRRQTYHLYLDEFHQWVDRSYADAMTNLRQFGLSCCNAHQSQSQPPFDTAEGRSLLFTVQANSRIKVLFRLARPDAEALSRELFELSQRKENFQAVDRTAGSMEQVSRSTARTDGFSSGTSRKWGNVRGAGSGESAGLGVRGMRITKNQSHSFQEGRSEQSGSSHSEQHSEGSTQGTSQSETMRTVYFTLDGERELLVNSLQQLPPRQFYLSVEPLRGHLLTSPFVPDRLYSYQGDDLPQRLMVMQRERLPLPEEDDVQEVSPSFVPQVPSRALPAVQPEVVVVSSAAPVPSLRQDVAEAPPATIPKEEEDDPFLD